jgi:hypothetical protein
MNWHSLTKAFGIRTRSSRAQFELGEAYRRVFNGNPSRADQQLVLADIAAKAGWNTITPPSVASDELRFNEGKRAVFANIFAHISLAPADVQAFENAVRHEIVAEQQQS